MLYNEIVVKHLPVYALCVSVCARTHMYLCTHMSRGQRSTLGLISFALSTLSFRDGVSPWLEVH